MSESQNPNFLKHQSEDERRLSKKKPPSETLGLNLVTSESMKKADLKLEKRNLSQIFSSVVISLLLAGSAYIGTLVFGRISLQSLKPVQSELEQVTRRIGEIEKHKGSLLSFQQRMELVRSLLDEHIHWSQFFKEFEKATLPNVTFDAVSLTTDYQLTLSAHTTDYASVARQLVLFQKSTHLVKSVQITSANAVLNQGNEIEGVNFGVILVLNPDITKRIYARE